MEYFSQRDPAYSFLTLGNTKMTIYGFGCFLCSIGMLYQWHPRSLMAVQGGIIGSSGLLVSSVLAKACGGAALPQTTVPPQGWCIAVTNKYAPKYPTHFFCVHPQKKLQIDPLRFPAGVQPLTYPIVAYRPFTKISPLLP